MARHHESKKHHKHHKHEERHHARRRHEAEAGDHYAGRDERRRMEYEDSHMRHHESKRRRHEAEAGDYYAGRDERRRMEYEDSRMIAEDHNAIANLPQHVVMKEYPKRNAYLPEDLDDTIRGIDRQMDELDGGEVRRHLNPKKY